MTIERSPYLSFIVTSRNDGQGAESFYRTQIFIESLLSQLNRYGFDSELVIVEWNPPQDRKRLKNILKWPLKSSFCSVRIIDVPTEIHSRFENSDSIPLFQMIAKNAGIRRARGQFILATNIDILFSNELIQFFSTRTLCPDQMYRIDRQDVPFEIPDHYSVDERLEWCRRNVLRVYRYLEIVETKDGMIPPPVVEKSTMIKKAVDWLTRREKLLHTNACGDFTLLSAEYWDKVGGYPEFPLRAMKVDGLLCYAAHYAGARQTILQDPMRIYHLDHPARTDGALVAFSNRQTDSPSLQLPLSQYLAWTAQMRRIRKPIIFNEQGWGLPDEDLNETIID